MEHKELEQLPSVINNGVDDILEDLQARIIILQLEELASLRHHTTSLHSGQHLQSNLHQPHSQIQAPEQPSRTPRSKYRPHDAANFKWTSVQLRPWLAAIRAKPTIDGQAIGGDVAQLYYIYLHLNSNIQVKGFSQSEPAKTSGTFDLNTMADRLRTCD